MSSSRSHREGTHTVSLQLSQNSLLALLNCFPSCTEYESSTNVVDGTVVVRFRPHRGRDPRPWPSLAVDLQPAQAPGLQRRWATACGSSGAATNFCLRPQMGGGAGRGDPQYILNNQNLFLPRHLLGSRKYHRHNKLSFTLHIRRPRHRPTKFQNGLHRSPHRRRPYRYVPSPPAARTARRDPR